ncbi:hypothetical protein [Aliidongia dinghuensis]|nr:hypothetical protein [Aliidongia dinghuensis]
MKIVLELEIWSRPGELLPASTGKSLKSKFDRDTKLPPDVFLGLSSVPDQIDVRNLNDVLDSKEITKFEFENFCIDHGFDKDVDSVESASRFLDFYYGARLAWIHIPDELSSSISTKVTTEVVRVWAKAHGFVLVHPDLLYCLVMS